MNGAKKEEHRTRAQLLEDSEELRRRLEEAEQTLEAIRTGDVDALVVTAPQGEQVYTLSGAEHVYRMIVETMNEAALTVDPDGTILFSNQRFCDLIKTPMHEVLGRKVMNFAARPQHPCLKDVLADAQAGPVQQRVTLRAADGAAVPVQVSASLLATNGSTSICLVASDLTELEASARSVRVLREHQQALEESESRFRTIFEASRDAIVIADDEGTYVQANPAVQAVFGLPPEKLIGHHLSEFVGDHIDVPVVWRNFRATGSFHGEMPLTGADGQVRYVDAYAVANILPGRHLCVIRDVTERRRAEEALENATEQLQAQAEELQVQAEELRATNDELRKNEQALQEAEEHLHLAMEAGKVGVWEWEVGTERVKWSQGIYRLLGCKPGEVTLTREGFRQRVHPQDRQRQAQALRESMERCEDYSCEFRVVWMDGSVHWVEDRGQYVYVDDDNVTILRLRGALSDIDARKQSEEALRSVALFPEESPAPTLRVARDGTLLYANGASASLLRCWEYRAGQAAPEQIRRYVVQALDSQEIVEADVVCGPITYSFSIAPIASEGYANLYARDITERKRAEEALRESEQRNRRLIDNLKGSHFIYRHDTQGVFNYVSGSLTDILGYTPDEFMAHYSTYLTDHPVNKAVHRHTELSIQGIRQPPYEVNAWHKDGSSRWLEVQEVPVFDAAGKVIAVEGVAQDITERKGAEEALRESEERHRFLVESVNDWIWEVDQNGVYTYVSPQCREMLGYEPQEIVGKTPFDLMPPEEARRMREVFGAIAGQAKPIRRLENVNRRKDGRLVVLETNGVPVLDAQGKLAGYRGVDRDITERKRAEEALHSIALFPEENPWPVLRVAGDGTLLYANAASAQLLELWNCQLGQPIPDEIRGQVERTLDTGEVIDAEVVCGEVVYSFSLAPIASEDYVNLYGRDVTERKHAAEALRESRERLEHAQEIAHLGSWELDLVNDRLTWSDEVYRIFGLAPQEFGETYEAFLDRVHPEDRAAVDAAYAGSLRENRDTYEIEHRIVRKDTGEIRIVHEKCEHFRDAAGKIVRSVGMAHDVTERKQAEEALRESEERLRMAQQAARIGTFEWNIRTGVDRWTAELEAMYGLPPGGFAGTQEAWEQLIHPEDREEAKRRVARAFETGAPTEGEWRVVWPDGSVHWVAGRWQVFKDESGEPLRMTGINIDITERKQAEEALRRSEQRYHRLFEDDLTGNFVCTPEGRILLCNPAFAKTFGFSLAQEAVGTSMLDLYLDPKERQALLDELKNRGKIDRFEVWRKRRDGEPIYIVENLVGHFNEQGELYEIKGYVFDDTERQRAEEALRESEEKYRTLFNSIDQGFCIIEMIFDADGRPADYRFLEVNPAFEKQTGLHEAQGRLMRDLAPDHEAHWFEIYGRIALTGEPERFVNEAKALGRWYEVYAFRVGEPQSKRVAILFNDITERKRTEEQLRDLTRTLETKVARRTAELEHRARQLQKLALEVSEAEDRERKHLAEVLHDDLQQLIAAAKFHLQMLANRLRYDPSQQAIAAKVDQMLKDAVEKSRSLSHELSPAVLYHGNLVETFNWLASQIQAKHGLVVHVDAFTQVTVQSEALKAFLYKAAQELLFNVVKHARVSEARIRLRRLGRCVCLSVSDHGRGFDPQELRETTGFGLFSIRERIELLGGRMKIKSAKGQGSTFHIVVPDDGAALGPLPSSLATSPRRATGDERPATSDAPPALRVLLADDHEIVREGLASLLAEVPGVEVVGAAANGREAINLASKLRPDVVVMDVAMPLINGDEATRQIKLHLPGTRVVALSMYEEPDLVEKMRQAGAEGYILKTAPSEELIAAIRGR